MQAWTKLRLCCQSTVLSMAPWQISSLPSRSLARPMRLVARILRIAVFRVHVTFSVHDLVPFPVDDRTACNPDFEGVRMVCHQGDGHESAIAPAVYADAVCIDVRQRFQHLDSDHLIRHLALAEAAMDGLFIRSSAVLRAAVVLDIDDVPFLRHQNLPQPHLTQPGIPYHLGVRASIDIEDDRILLRRIETGGKKKTIPVVELPVGAFTVPSMIGPVL